MNRKWIYHKEHKIWLMRDTSHETMEKTPTYERGWFIYFDPMQWEKVRSTYSLPLVLRSLSRFARI